MGSHTNLYKVFGESHKLVQCQEVQKVPRLLRLLLEVIKEAASTELLRGEGLTGWVASKLCSEFQDVDLAPILG